MEYGVVFPHHEIGTDPSSIREFAQAVEGLGFTHLLIYDHVLGADPERPGGWSGPYDKDVAFHEPFVTFGFIAAVTSRIELVTAVLVLPQRQTALVAKQAAEVDLLSGGRLRLGIGTGWNEVEYEGLSASFRDRGRRRRRTGRGATEDHEGRFKLRRRSPCSASRKRNRPGRSPGLRSPDASISPTRS